MVRESARAGRIVFFEESARDGAQAKTLMSAGFRVRLAREQGAVFGADGPRHVVFAAGFPSVCNRTGQAPAATAALAVAMFGPGIPVTDADHLRAIDAPHAATTMLRIAPDGALTHIRNGAQDRAHGTDPALYLKHLHAAGNQARSAASTADLPSATWNE